MAVVLRTSPAAFSSFSVRDVTAERRFGGPWTARPVRELVIECPEVKKK
jgi:hypothetical protein